MKPEERNSLTVVQIELEKYKFEVIDALTNAMIPADVKVKIKFENNQE